MIARGDNHIALAVADIGTSIAFYEEVLGARLCAGPYRYEGPYIDEVFGLEGVVADVCHLKLDRNALELWQLHEPRVSREPLDEPRRGIMHFGVEVDDVDQAAARVEQAGGRRRFAIKQIGDDPNARFVYCEDPDGNMFELINIPHDEIVRLGRLRQQGQTAQAS
jgi:catechol 2,3-dioxygenase-like lactoylglutathione lyase family enzyme